MKETRQVHSGEHTSGEREGEGEGERERDKMNTEDQRKGNTIKKTRERMKELKKKRESN